MWKDKSSREAQKEAGAAVVKERGGRRRVIIIISRQQQQQAAAALTEARLYVCVERAALEAGRAEVDDLDVGQHA